MPEVKTPARLENLITSCNDDKTAFGLLVAAAVAMFEIISKALPGFLKTLLSNFLPASADIQLKFMKKPPSPSAFVVLSLTVKDFSLLQTEQ